MTKRKDPKDIKPAGRKPKYKKEFDEQAYKLTLLGFTDAQLAKFFEVQESTINKWKKDHPTFSESVNRGKDMADAEVAHSLYNRAKGFENDEVEIKVVSLGNNLGSEIKMIPVIKYYAPDTRAIQYWMGNRRRKRAADEDKPSDPAVWADRHEIDHTSAGEKLAAPMVYMPGDLDEADVIAQAQQAQENTTQP